eukprot:COSAG01_NODE_312_length_19063_cov_207.879825_9_plen_58_part_00
MMKSRRTTIARPQRALHEIRVETLRGGRGRHQRFLRARARGRCQTLSNIDYLSRLMI